MKNLKIVYNGMVLFDGDVEELQWKEVPTGVTVSGVIPRRSAAGGGFLESLVAARKKQTDSMIAEKRAELADHSDHIAATGVDSA